MLSYLTEVVFQHRKASWFVIHVENFISYNLIYVFNYLMSLNNVKLARDLMSGTNMFFFKFSNKYQFIMENSKDIFLAMKMKTIKLSQGEG